MALTFEFEEEYQTLDKYPGSIQMSIEEHGWQSNWKMETKINKIIEIGSEYFEDLKKGLGKQILTSEEKKLVLLMKKLIEDLREKWDDIYLVRNEGSFKIYEFGKPGRAFEPDYVLFANDKRNASVSWQIFIEPKGNHLIEHDAWKQDFLLKLSKEAKIVGEDADTRVIGVPFFNGDIEKQSHVIEGALKAL